MQKILLVNPAKAPSKRKKKAKTVQVKTISKARRNATNKGSHKMATRKKRRSAAQKAATRKLVALNKRRSGPTKRRAPAPARKVARRRRRNPIVSVTPRRRRRAATSVAPMRRRRRNPIRAKGMMDSIVIPALTASAGALALDVAWAYAPIPLNLKVGNLKHVSKAAGAIGLSWLASQVVSKKTAEAMGVGALTVVFHDALREMAAKTMPALKMDGMGYYNAGYPAGTLEDPNGMGYYPPAALDANNANNGMGYYPPTGAVISPEQQYNNGMSY